MTTIEPRWSLRTRLIAFVLVCFAALIFAFVPLTTWLGVKVVATLDYFGYQTWDKIGSDWVWRVWWRSRHAIFTTSHETLLTIGFVGLFIAFVLAGLWCVWLLLTLPTSEPTINE
mgnify:CR=1 FL=1